MAYTSIGQIATTTSASMYTVSAGKTVFISSLSVVNYAASTAEITIVWRDFSSGADFELGFEVSVPANTVYAALPTGVKFFMNEGDQLLIKSSLANTLKVITSIAEA